MCKWNYGYACDGHETTVEIFCFFIVKVKLNVLITVCLCAFCLKKAVPKMTYIVSLLTHPSPLYPSHHFVNICVTVNLASENCFRKILCFVLHRLISERECCNSFLTELQSVSRCMLLISYPVCEIFCICVVQMPTITACICYSCFCSVFFLFHCYVYAHCLERPSHVLDGTLNLLTHPLLLLYLICRS